MKKKMLVIINPCAGRTKSKAGTFDIVDVLSTLEFDVDIKEEVLKSYIKKEEI